MLIGVYSLKEFQRNTRVQCCTSYGRVHCCTINRSPVIIRYNWLTGFYHWSVYRWTDRNRQTWFLGREENKLDMHVLCEPVHMWLFKQPWMNATNLSKPWFHTSQDLSPESRQSCTAAAWFEWRNIASRISSPIHIRTCFHLNARVQ